MIEEKVQTCEDASCLIFKEFHSAAVHQVVCVRFPNCCIATSHKCSGLRQDPSSHCFRGLQALASNTGSFLRRTGQLSGFSGLAFLPGNSGHQNASECT